MKPLAPETTDRARRYFPPALLAAGALLVAAYARTGFSSAPQIVLLFAAAVVAMALWAAHIIRQTTFSLWTAILVSLALYARLCLFDGSMRIQPQTETAAAALFLAGLAASLVVGGYLASRRLLRPGHRILFVLALGLFLRLAYNHYTGPLDRQHDVWNGPGDHLDYMRIVSEGRLPDSYADQFYHPPLTYAVNAAVYRLARLVGPGGNEAVESILAGQVLVGLLTLCAANALLAETGLDTRARGWALAFLAFHPSLTVFSTAVNNDNLLYLWVALSLLFCLRHFRTGRAADAVLCGFSFACGQLTKSSMLMYAPVCAVPFLLRLWNGGFARDEIRRWPAAILPALTGFVFLARNRIVFGQPFQYIPAPGGRDQYVGGYSWWERFGFHDAAALYKVVFTRFALPNAALDYNVWSYLARSSLFNEYALSGRALGRILIVLSLAATALFLMTMIRRLARLARRKPFFSPPFSQSDAADALMTAAVWIPLAAYIAVNVKMPYACTMDFRYILPVLFPIAYFLGASLASADTSAAVKRTTVCTITLFCFASILYML